MPHPFPIHRNRLRSALVRRLCPGSIFGEPASNPRRWGSERAREIHVEDWAELAGRPEWSAPDAIDLATASPRFDLVPSASTKLPADRRGYPPLAGLPELRQAVAQRLRTDQGLRVDSRDGIHITAGATGALAAALEALVSPGDRVVLLDPSSPLFSLAARSRRARIRWVPTSMEGGRTRFVVGALARALAGARLLILASPASPTGGSIGPEDLEPVAWWARRRGALLLSDEVYAAFTYDGWRMGVGSLPAAHGRALTVGSVSKSYGMTSTRVGWLAGDPALVRACARATARHNPFVPTLCQQLAVAALTQPPANLEGLRQEFASRRRYAFERLEGLGLKPAWPSGAFFLWVPVADLGGSGRSFAERLWQAKRVAVCPGDGFGPGAAGHVRISYAGDDGRLREGLARLGEFVRELRASGSQTAKAAA